MKKFVLVLACFFSLLLCGVFLNGDDANAVDLSSYSVINQSTSSTCTVRYFTSSGNFTSTNAEVTIPIYSSTQDQNIMTGMTCTYGGFSPNTPYDFNFTYTFHGSASGTFSFGYSALLTSSYQLGVPTLTNNNSRVIDIQSGTSYASLTAGMSGAVTYAMRQTTDASGNLTFWVGSTAYTQSYTWINSAGLSTAITDHNVYVDWPLQLYAGNYNASQTAYSQSSLSVLQQIQNNTANTTGSTNITNAVNNNTQNQTNINNNNKSDAQSQASDQSDTANSTSSQATVDTTSTDTAGSAITSIVASFSNPSAANCNLNLGSYTFAASETMDFSNIPLCFGDPLPSTIQNVLVGVFAIFLIILIYRMSSFIYLSYAVATGNGDANDLLASVMANQDAVIHVKAGKP